MSRFFQRALTLLAKELTGRRFSDESVMPQSPTISYPVRTGEYSYFLIDLLRQPDGRWACIEVNGSNAAGSSANRGDLPRVAHMVSTRLARGLPGSVWVVAYQAGTPCLPEITCRVALLAQAIECRTGSMVHLEWVHPECTPTLPSAEVETLICGPIEQVQRCLSVDHGRLLYLGSSVAFASNSNLVPALLRLRHLPPDPMVFHEGRGTPIVLDKVLQQRIAERTSLSKIECASLDSIEEVLDFLASYRDDPWVVKMRGGSGAAGVSTIAPRTQRVRARHLVESSLEGAREKYESLATAFPLQVFQFVQASPLYVNGLPYQWDLRVELLVEPTAIHATALSARRCPEPFDGSYKPPTVIANLTGIGDGNQRVISPAELASGIGLGFEELIAESCAAAAQWAQEAMRFEFEMPGPGTG